MFAGFRGVLRASAHLRTPALLLLRTMFSSWSATLSSAAQGQARWFGRKRPNQKNL